MSTSEQPRLAARRAFITAASAAAALPLAGSAAPRPLSDKEKLARIASNTWPVRTLFKTRGSGRAASPETEAFRKKYGEITMLDFPQFTRDTFPGVRHMDLWSSLFGDFSDESMYAKSTFAGAQGSRTFFEFDPSTPSGRKWLDKLAAKIASTGIKCHHVSNNAPRDICDLDETKRKEGIAVAKKWLDGSAQIGAKTMRVNTGGPRIAPNAVATRDYPRNDEIVKYLKNAIDSFREMAEYGAKVGVKVTIENHWGLSANPTNVQIILDEVNHPFCEASPDFCNWEHEYMLYHGLQALAPYTHSTVHAKYWNRWKEVDVKRCVRIMTKAGFKGIFALEYEDGPWDGVEGARYLFKEVMAAL
ncbi:MAG: TIM barrel protein [Acidobacteria bacterium]|nr:TIM barrel protein [Acidobacteriota bacterium]